MVAVGAEGDGAASVVLRVRVGWRCTLLGVTSLSWDFPRKLVRSLLPYIELCMTCHNIYVVARYNDMSP